MCQSIVFFFNDTATTEIYTLSLHDALPILDVPSRLGRARVSADVRSRLRRARHSRHGAHGAGLRALRGSAAARSEEHTSELQSLAYLVCRLLLEKKKQHHSKQSCPSFLRNC